MLSKLQDQKDSYYTAKSPNGRVIRTHASYWNKIKTVKHVELEYDLTDALDTLINPDFIHKSLKDDTMQMFYKTQKDGVCLVCVVKILNGEGFLVTAYQTSKPKPKGDLIWHR